MAQVLKGSKRLLCGLLLWVVQSIVWADDIPLLLQSAPSWASPVEAFDPSLQARGNTEYGLHDRLSDLQINATQRGNTQIYNAVEYSLTNMFGVENFSTVEISFDPMYQTLSLHELVVNRNGQLLQKFDSTQFEILASAKTPIELVYDGTLTLSAHIADLRAGDIVRYAYTLSGDNPVYRGSREFYVNTELWTQLERQYVRVLTQADSPLNRRVRGANVSVAVKERRGVQELVIDQRSVATIQSENDVPSWREARGTLVFSDMESWQDVARWALPLYTRPELADDAVVKLANTIRSSNDDENAQIGAALQWVQEQIETVSVDASRNSHLPATPANTLRYGFGDSKDKALLLVALLESLGIESSVALVNTMRGLAAEDYPHRLHAFNHALVHISRQDESHFIDPSRVSQLGATLGELHEPNYGRALILTPNTVALTTMSDARSATHLVVRKELTLPIQWAEVMRTSMKDQDVRGESAAGLTVVSRKQGLLAEQVRSTLQLGGRQAVDETYLNYYQVLFPSISVVDSVDHQTIENNGSASTERYSIDDFWHVDDKVGEHRWLYADDVISYLTVPKKRENRRQAYELLHPVSVEETWIVPVSSSVRMYLQEETIENEWVSFSKKAVIDEQQNLATITFTYATRSNEVAARDLDVYVKSVEKITDHASFYLQHAPVLAAANELPELPWNTAKVKFWTIFIGMIYFTGWWLHFMRRYRKTVTYYEDES